MMPSTEEHTTAFNKTAIFLHWFIALLLLAQFLIGLDMVNIPKGPDSTRAFWFNTHKSIGIFIGCIVLFRLYWRFQSKVPGLPPKASSWERFAATASHASLYFCMIVMPLSGILGSLFSKYDLLVFGVRLPKFLEHDPVIKELMTIIHQSISYFFLMLISVHILAAVKHLVIDCDGVFDRMMPNFSGTSKEQNFKKNEKQN